MEVDKVVMVRTFLAWCLLATTAIALAGCRGAGASPEAGNATVAQRYCHGGECLIAYRQPEVELMAALDPEHALGGMLALKPGTVTNGAKNPSGPAGCGRTAPGRYTSCTTQAGPNPRYSPYYRKGS